MRNPIPLRLRSQHTRAQKRSEDPDDKKSSEIFENHDEQHTDLLKILQFQQEIKDLLTAKQDEKEAFNAELDIRMQNIQEKILNDQERVMQRCLSEHEERIMQKMEKQIADEHQKKGKTLEQIKDLLQENGEAKWLKELQEQILNEQKRIIKTSFSKQEERIIYVVEKKCSDERKKRRELEKNKCLLQIEMATLQESHAEEKAIWLKELQEQKEKIAVLELKLLNMQRKNENLKRTIAQEKAKSKDLMENHQAFEAALKKEVKLQRKSLQETIEFLNNPSL
ncbi:coiled-coil domain-containing protein 91 [Bombina bombina]|uniref:coiled-coil domain-containing protein 91 n=1 Tax=Bombina bombina TaxID=8345 RepID=UPI00235AA859|nr:coiled-coil domain-containing protein 91 [Bombina bombina]